MPIYPRLLSAVAIIFVAACSHADTGPDLQKAKVRDGRPNIVLFVSDDHGLETLGAYGNKVIQTPNLDALAMNGTIFTRAYSNSSICSPSRATLLTGLHNHANGMYGLAHAPHSFQVHESTRSISQILKANGYLTARVGKYHIAPDSVFAFDQVLEDDDAAIIEGDSGSDAVLQRDPVRMAALTETFIREADEPFFLYFATSDPHRSSPFDSYPEANTFGSAENPQLENIVYHPGDVVVPHFLPDTEDVRKDLAAYYTSISRLDSGLGALVSLLKKHDAYDNTVIIYLSDNGPAFPGAKTNLYEPGIHLPLIVRAPDQTARGSAANDLVSWIDITPTILDYAEIPTDPFGFHGDTIRPAIANNSPLNRQKLFASQSLTAVTKYYPMRMVRNGDLKLIWNIVYQTDYPMAIDLFKSTSFRMFQDGLMGSDLVAQTVPFGSRPVVKFKRRAEFELYDLATDPHETNNLVDDPQYAEVLAEMVSDMETFQRETGDPWIDRWTNP